MSNVKPTRHQQPGSAHKSWNYGDEMAAKPYPVGTAVQAVINHLAEGDAKFAQHKPAEFIETVLFLTSIRVDSSTDSTRGPAPNRNKPTLVQPAVHWYLFLDDSG
jgi:hypothetical protein